MPIGSKQSAADEINKQLQYIDQKMSRRVEKRKTEEKISKDGSEFKLRFGIFLVYKLKKESINSLLEDLVFF